MGRYIIIKLGKGFKIMKKIIVFTTQTWPHCKTAKVYLREKGYEFEERDINKDTVARNEMIKRGIRGVPAFLIGDEMVEGLDRAKIERLMKHDVINCPNCNSKLRVPSDKGKIKVTCPTCSTEFQWGK